MSALIVCYSVGVIALVGATGDAGIRCIFGPKVKEVAAYTWLIEPAFGGVQAGHNDPLFALGPPEPGATLTGWRTAVGSQEIRGYPDYVQMLRDLRGRVGQVVGVSWVDAGGEPRWGQLVVATPPFRTYVWTWVWLFQELAIFAVGARVYWRRPADASARLFFWLCIFTVGAYMGGYHWTQVVDLRILIYPFALFAVFVPVVSLHFYLVFPAINPWFRRRRGLALALLYGVPSAWVAALWTCMSWSSFDGHRPNVDLALLVLGRLALAYVAWAVGLFVLCAACLLRSYRAAGSRAERNQVQWILLATLFAFGPICYLLLDAWRDPSRLGLNRSVWPMFVVSLLYTVAYAFSITRYKLIRAEQILNRGVVYFAVSLSAGLVYTGLIVAGTMALDETLLSKRTPLGALAAGVTALVVVVLSEAARRRFQRAIDRRFDREKYKLDQAMRQMSLAVDSLVDRETLAKRLLEAAAEVLRLEWGAIYVSTTRGGPMELAACLGPAPDERVLAARNPLIERLGRSPRTLRVPGAISLVPDLDPATDAMIALGGEVATALIVEGTLAGILVLGPKRNGLPYEDEEVAFLGGLGSVATLALHSASIQRTLEGLNRELSDKVEKIAEQQRRISILQGALTNRQDDGAPTPPARPRAEPSVFGPIKGSGPAVKAMLDVARKVANSPSAVLIRGESGTGKELLAAAIHASSPRANGPFVKVHCAALSQGLLESELFGHVKGAFTTADRDRVGRFQLADGGTLFLDEIGDINLEVQTKLLRVLQEMAFERVGSSARVVVDVRILAATHQDLEALIEAGKFREDLYYRLNVISVRAPSLRERRDDIFELAVHFLGLHGRRVGKTLTHLDDSAVEALLAHDWPGNIRELENVIERAVVLADGPSITVDDLPAEVRRPTRRRARLAIPVAAGVMTSRARASQWTDNRPADSGLDAEVEAFERSRLVDALNEADGNKSEGARLLGMPRSTFFSKLKKHGLG